MTTTTIPRRKKTTEPHIIWTRIHFYPRGQKDVQSCHLFRGEEPGGKIRYRVLVVTKFPGSYAWPVDVAFVENRQQLFGTTTAIEFGIAHEDTPRDITWRPLGEFPRFNNSHRQDGIFRKPDYVIMTKDWVPVARSKDGMNRP